MSESPLSAVMKKIITIVVTVISAATGYQLSKFFMDKKLFSAMTTIHPLVTYIVVTVLLGLVGFLIAPLFWILLCRISMFFESKMQNINIWDASAGLVGLIVGLLLANLLALPMSRIPGNISVYISILLNISFGYVGLMFFLKRRGDFSGFMNNLSELKVKLPKIKKRHNEIDLNLDEVMSVPKVLDTSAIIDGRILDVARTGFMEGTIILPHFILTELQGIADSTDPLRRSKGRRGLSVVNELKKVKTINILIPEITIQQLQRSKVDEALVVLAKEVKGKVITTDYNLNQVANIEGVSVLNVNDLSNSLKPLLLPGEEVEIDVIRQGKENHQGVGYLDDGTMLVVENGQEHVGERVTVTITSMLQTSAGRMVFGRIQK